MMEEKELSRSLRLNQLQNFLSLKTPSGGATLEQIMAHCSVTHRQIYRDLNDLEQKLGTKVIRPKRGQRGERRYKLDESLPLKIGPETAATIFLSILRQKGSPLEPGINEVKDTLVAALFKNKFGGRQKDLENLQSRVSVIEDQLLDESKVGKILFRLMEAIKDNKVVSIKYYKPSSNEFSKRDVKPYGLISKDNNWYMVAYCKVSNGIRTFRMDLIEHVYVLTEKFEFPEDFSLQSYIGDSWGVFSSDETKRIVVKIRPEIAYRFKLIAYHPSQKVEQELEDGSIIVSYYVCGNYEFISWALKWCELLEILEPADIREQVKSRIEKLVEIYKD